MIRPRWNGYDIRRRITERLRGRPLEGSASSACPLQPFEAISLGETCSVKFQIARHLLLADHPDGGVDVLREAVATGRAGRVFSRHIFDWQITPVEALVVYLEQDFAGVFERADLIVSPDGEVVNRQLNTRHPHDFHAADPAVGLTEADLDAQYPAARSKFNHLAHRFRAHLRRPGRFLYVLNRWPDPETAGRIIARLSANGDEHRFQLLCADVAGSASELSQADPRIALAHLPSQVDKPDALEWEGDDGAWDRIFADHPIRHFGIAFSSSLRVLGEAPAPGVRPLAIILKQPPDWAPVQLPAVLSVPDAPWTYGAFSEAIVPEGADAPLAVEIGIEVLEGRVSIALTSPDASRVIGRPQALSAGEGSVRAHLPVPAQAGPVHLVLRNAGEAGVGGRALIRWIGVMA